MLLAAWLGGGAVVDLAVDALWFDGLGFLSTFQTVLGARLALGIGGALLAAIFLALNLRHATRAAPLDLRRLDELLVELRPGTGRLRELVRLALAAAVLVPAALLGLRASAAWPELLLASQVEPIGRADPVFGRDLGFHLFLLPLLRLAQQQLSAMVTMAALVVGGWYLVRDGLLGRGGAAGLSRAGRGHALFIGALLLLTHGLDTYLQRYATLTRQEGFVWGAGHADVVARIPGMTASAVLSVLLAVALLAQIPRRGLALPLGLFGASILGRTLLVGIIPSTVQDWVVRPNELQLERPYLEASIAATREAYALDRIEVKPFLASSTLDAAALQANALTIENIRIWDDRPLLTTYGQLQEIRLYYDFVDVDIDRYTLDGQHRQVMLAARELNASNLPTAARSWVNEHLHYTHGYGLTMSPVNVVTAEGLPELLIRDLPPVLQPSLVRSGLKVDRPEIYFGELTDRYALVRTTAEEFDYPMGDQNAYTRYEGKGGIPIGSLARRALFAAHLGSVDLLLTGYLTEESQILIRRTITERVQTLAPFLRLDADPYLVIDEGRLFWVLDAYTIASTFPYSEPVRRGGRSFNYIRNSVKVVVDAYDGTVRFFLADTEDPIIAAWARVLPGMFEPLAALSPGLQAHLRYPADFFDVQAHIYRAYHMTEPTVFYNKEDMWELPRELYGGQEELMESYYLTMRLPGEEEAEFILLVPFVPTNRDNMIAWLAARSDGEQYGKLILYQFPKQKLIYGPRQVESRIDQDPVISQQISLWSQSGSRVVRGNLLVVPVEDALLYVEPLYLQSQTSQLPELKRVIVSYENRIAMEETLAQALKALFGAPSPAREEAATGAPPAEGPVDWQARALDADRLLQEAIALQREGDWAGYGRTLALLRAELSALRELAGAASPASSGAD